MKRRNFIKFTTILGILSSTNFVLARTFSNENLMILDELLNIIFPKTQNMPSAKEFKALEYLVQNISHKTFDDEDKALIIDGTNDFNSSFSEFLTLNQNEKKRVDFSNYSKQFLCKILGVKD